MNIDIRRKALVIGATGLLGYGVTHELDKTGWKVRAIGKENIVSSYVFPNSVEYRCGDFYDETFLLYSIKDIDKVFFFCPLHSRLQAPILWNLRYPEH